MSQKVDILTVSEAARALEVAGQTVRQWADTGKLAAQRTASGQRLFRKADVERLRRERQKPDAAA